MSTRRMSAMTMKIRAGLMALNAPGDLQRAPGALFVLEGR
jgi:hypothetical protein